MDEDGGRVPSESVSWNGQNRTVVGGDGVNLVRMSRLITEEEPKVPIVQ